MESEVVTEYVGLAEISKLIVPEAPMIRKKNLKWSAFIFNLKVFYLRKNELVIFVVKFYIVFILNVVEM
jgi:hypothetical protein